MKRIRIIRPHEDAGLNYVGWLLFCALSLVTGGKCHSIEHLKLQYEVKVKKDNQLHVRMLESEHERLLR
ncbi:hypothetical protein [Paenibacillus campinasensis]|uniref:Uncharacterized protein n=1 Tax=Paenibacillus campinasensis TaxID=66347 RepID=A0A268EJ87_9BACL|nr:hypothetical protein [Paenibacillus campinasensis]PAD73183.1 hypothetical protein CHH67_20740 [Paenibacillus campinasensis]